MTKDDREATIRRVGEYHAKRRNRMERWLAKRKPEDLPKALALETEMLRKRVELYSILKLYDQGLAAMVRIWCLILGIYLLFGIGNLTLFFVAMAMMTLATIPAIKIGLFVTEATMKDVMSMMTTLAAVFKVKTEESEELLDRAIDVLAAEWLLPDDSPER